MVYWAVRGPGAFCAYEGGPRRLLVPFGRSKGTRGSGAQHPAPTNKTKAYRLYAYRMSWIAYNPSGRFAATSPCTGEAYEGRHRCRPYGYGKAHCSAAEVCRRCGYACHRHCAHMRRMTPLTAAIFSILPHKIPCRNSDFVKNTKSQIIFVKITKRGSCAAFLPYGMIETAKFV